MAYPACGGEYVVVEGDGEVDDCPRPLEGRQLTVYLAEPLFLWNVDLELLLLFLVLAFVVVADSWLDWMVLAGLADCWLDEVRVVGWLGVGLGRLVLGWL